MKWAGHIARTGEKSGAYKVLVGKSEGNIPLGGLRRRCGDNIKRDLWEVGWVVDWIDLAQDRDKWRAFVIAVMKLRVL